MTRIDLWLNQSTILLQPITIPVECLKYNDALAYALGISYETAHRLGCCADQTFIWVGGVHYQWTI